MNIEADLEADLDAELAAMKLALQKANELVAQLERRELVTVDIKPVRVITEAMIVHAMQALTDAQRVEVLNRVYRMVDEANVIHPRPFHMIKNREKLLADIAEELAKLLRVENCKLPPQVALHAIQVAFMEGAREVFVGNLATVLDVLVRDEYQERLENWSRADQAVVSVR